MFAYSGFVPSRPWGESLNGFVMGTWPLSTYQRSFRCLPSQSYVVIVVRV